MPDIQRQVTYVLNLFPSELHVFVRPEIKSLNDLVGKKVNFNTLGTAAAYSGPLIFSRLGLDVEQTFIPHQVALEQMRKGEMAAVVFITSKPVDAFVRGRWEPGFKFLPVPYDSKFEDYYLPAALEATDYPALIKPGERMETISVPTALVAYNWPANSNRYERVARFVDYLFSRIDKLQAPGFDPKWKSINLAATVPGLARFPAAQAWLDGQSRQRRHRNETRGPPAPGCSRGRERDCAGARGGSDGAASRLLADGACGTAGMPGQALAGRRAFGSRRRPRATAGSSARRRRPSTIRRSPPPQLHRATLRAARRCSSRFAAAADAPN